MSQMIPQITVNVLRSHQDISVDLYGIDCDLYIKDNSDAQELHIYDESPESTFKEKIITKVFIEWSPNKYKLRKLGLFVEQNVPIIAWLKHDENLVIGSYFVISQQYVPKQYDTEKFELVTPIVRGSHDAEAVTCWKVVPLRSP